MIILSKIQVLGFVLLVLALGFTFLTYSQDGDIALRKRKAVLPQSEENEWERLHDLTTYHEVTWNKSLFISFIISVTLVVFESRNIYNLFWVTMVVSFASIDTVNRWNQAHRKDLISYESSQIIKRLRTYYKSK
jgi:hypothetical protein